MKGDKLIIGEHHRRAATRIAAILVPEIEQSASRFVVTIAGESGSGKSETGAALSEALAGLGIGSVILQQDDYFIYPPKTNEQMRRRNIDHVGISEVRLDLLDADLADAHAGKESIDLSAAAAVIVEGTYTTLLANVNHRVFIDRSHVDTHEARKHRARDVMDDFLEQVLEIEHGIISPQKSRADIIITREYEVRENEPDR